MQQHIDLEPLMTSKEVMAYFHISRSTLIRLREAGQLPGHRIGAQWRYFACDVKQALHPTPIVQVTEQGEYTPETFYEAEKGQEGK